MAAGFFNEAAPGRSFKAESAGVRAVDGANPSLLAILEMKRRGVDITAHRARNISSVDPDQCHRKFFGFINEHLIPFALVPLSTG